MVDTVAGGWTALCALALVLGARHGLDADHLATIDGLTRYNARENPRIASWVGALFSAGHGIVVVAVAIVAGSLASRFQVPEWLEITGVGVSVTFLFGTALLNLHTLATSRRSVPVLPTGLKARLIGRFLTVRRGWAVAVVGALFALSFDTISQTAMFALAATQHDLPLRTVIVAMAFVLGMLAVDGASGLWIGRLVRRADHTAAIASRVMALFVALLGLSVGAFVLARATLPDVDQWGEANALGLSFGIIASAAAAFALSMLMARRSPSALAVET